MHHFPGQRSKVPTARLEWLLPEFFHDRLSSERDIPAQACRFSCFFCAAYGLLLTQTRTQCSNSASRAIAMLEKSAKNSPNVCAGISLSNECGHVENSYVLINDANFEKNIKFYTLFCLVYRSTKSTANKVERPICTD